MRRLTGFLAALGCVAALITSNVARAETPEDWDKVVAAAKQEGKVSVYSGYLSPTNDAIAKAFEAKYGIKVETLQARGNELRERLRIEQATGRPIGDVSHSAVFVLLSNLQNEKTLAPIGWVPNASRLNAAFKSVANEYFVPIFTINYGILVNTRLVKPEDEPKSWLDLHNPKWQGKILSDDPRAAGGGRVMFMMTVDKFGREYQEKLATQKVTFARDYNESTRRVARGEYPIYLPYILSDFINLGGLPVKYIIPTEGVTYGSYGVAISKTAPHPNAARLMANFYLSEEVQAIYAKTAHGIVVDQLEEKLPANIEALAKVKPLVAENFPFLEPATEMAIKIYGK